MLQTVVVKNKGKGKAGPSDPIVLSSDEGDYMPIRRLPASNKRRREILPASSLGSDTMPITIDSDEDVKPVFGTPNNFKRQKQTTLNRYRSGLKNKETEDDDVKVISETSGPRLGSVGSPGRFQQDIKPSRAVLDQPVQPLEEPRFPGHFGNANTAADPVGETKPQIDQSRPPLNLPSTWNGSRKLKRIIEASFGCSRSFTVLLQEAARRLEAEAKIILDPLVLRKRPHMTTFINERRRELRDGFQRIRAADMGNLYIQVKPPSRFLLQTFTNLGDLWPEEMANLQRQIALQREQLENLRIERIEAVQRMQRIKQETQMHIGGTLDPPVLGNAVAGPSQPIMIPAYPNGPTPGMQPQFDLLAVADNEADLLRRSGPQLREDE
jgi:hypothetical protein